MRVMKKGKIVDIPIKRGTVVKLRDSNGRLTGRKGIVVQNAPDTNFTRAYGREVFVCTFAKGFSVRADGSYVARKNAGDLYPVGKVRKLPPACKAALDEYARTYPTLGPKKRKRR